MALLAKSCLFSLLVSIAAFHRSSSRSFIVDYEQNVFLKDGQPFRYVSGSMHYFRVPREYWRDRLAKMKAAGLDAVQTYVAWHVHERVEGQYDFEGDNDLVNFTQVAASLGLLVIMRPGPFIAAERDMGGQPPWLMKNYTAEYAPLFRTLSNTAYMNAVDRWFDVLLPKLKPLIYANGGPIIAVQVENEYGSIHQCDAQYMGHLQALFERHLSKDVVLFTNNGCTNTMLECGTLPEVLSTLDFGGGARVAQSCFGNQRFYQPAGPLVNSEFYPGWFDHWGVPFAHVKAETVATELDALLSMNISVNFYMFHGGTNFGFMSGANFDHGYKPQLTSYDYDAPLNESGDPTHKYFVLRAVIMKHKGLPPAPVPPPTPKYSYGAIQMTKLASLLDVVHELSSPAGPIHTLFPRTMESVGQNFGFVLYRTQIPPKFANKQVQLNIQRLHDRGIVFVGQVRKATLIRSQLTNTTISIMNDLTLDILVENQGHVTNSPADLKGIVGNVSINGAILSTWEMYSLNLDELVECGEDCVHSLRGSSDPFTPTFYVGNIPPSPDGVPKDTFLKFDKWHKGQVFVNGFNLGRYWPAAGPQETLYLPAPVLSAGQKESRVVLLELDGAPCGGTPEECFIESVSTPILNGPVHPYNINAAI